MTAPSESVKRTYNDALTSNNLPRFERAVAAGLTEFNQGITVVGQPPDQMFYAQSDVQVMGQKIFTCAPCSVLNSVRALGLETHTTVSTISTRLMAAEKGRKDTESPLIKKLNDSNTLWVTPEGIDHLYELAASPLGKEGLPIAHFTTIYVDTVHQALLHGYKAVFIDQILRHALAIIGAKQMSNTALWEILPPDELIFRQTQLINPNTILVSYDSAVRSLWVDPRRILDRIAPLVSLVGLQNNPWKPPEDVYEDQGDLGEIKIE